jgi:ketosteroid isomerase-like protein
MTSPVERGPGWAFYEEQIRFCETKDIAGIRSHYTDDATLITFDRQIVGGDAIAEYFVGYLDGLPGLRLKSTDRFVETADTIFLEATISLDTGEARVYDAFVLRDGKAFRHFAGVLGFTSRD